MEPIPEAVPKDPLEFFCAEFFTNAESSDERVEILQNLSLVASSIGPNEIKTRLLPILLDIGKVDANDEVLHCLAFQLEGVARCMGSETDYSDLVPILDMLCRQDEAAVREAAVTAISDILELCSEHFKAVFVGNWLCLLFDQLSSAEQLTYRAAAMKLFPVIYIHITALDVRKRVTQTFVAAAKDEAPTVQRAVASSVVELMKFVPSNDALEAFHPLILQFWGDELQDNLRTQAIEAAAILTSRLSMVQIEKYTLPTLQAASCDPSWGIRLSFLNFFNWMRRGPEAGLLEETLTRWLESLIIDNQPEVQVEALDCLDVYMSEIPPGKILLKFLPLFARLVDSPLPSTKASLANLMGKTAKKVGQQGTIKIVLPMVEMLLKHPAREVRSNIASQLSDLSECLGASTTLEMLMGNFHLAMEDSQWRIRLTFVAQLPRIMKIVGPDCFAQQASSMGNFYFRALLDTVCAVRQAAVNVSEAVGLAFGKQWSLDNLAKPTIILFDFSLAVQRDRDEETNAKVMDKPTELPPEFPYTEAVQKSPRMLQSYMLRNTLLHAVEKLAITLDREASVSMIFPRLIKSMEDPIPNIRITVLKILTNLARAQILTADDSKPNILPALEKMLEKDVDEDVKCCAQALSDLLIPSEGTAAELTQAV